MWSTRNKETSTRNKRSNYCGLGLFLIILGVIFTAIPIPYLGGGFTLGVFLILIGVILLLAGASSKSGGFDKSLNTTDSIMKEREHCPKCGARRYSRFTRKCGTCGYDFISDSRQVPTISNKEVEEPKRTSDVQMFPPISGIKEINGQTNLNWLKHQYYDLGRTMQDIANELGCSMITIRKLLDRIEAISEKEEIKSMIDVPTLKTEEVQPIPQVSDIKEETPKIIPTEEVKPRPPVLEKKVEEPKKSSDVEFFPPISELLQGEKTSKPIPSVSELKTEETQTASSISEKKVEKSFTTCPHCRRKLPLGAKFCFNCGQKVEVLKPIPPISDIEEETPKITLAEEIQPIPPVYVKKEEKRKKEPRACKFCGMRLPKNKAFCLQCGMIIKIK